MSATWEMNVKSISIFLVALISSLASFAQAETWNIQEGPNAEWHGTWTIDGTNKDFTCSQKSGSTVLTANCRVIRQGEFYAIAKRDVTPDRNACNYFGSRSGNTISGQYFCVNGGPYNWTATVSQ